MTTPASQVEELYTNLTDIYELSQINNDTYFNSSGPAHCGNRLENDDYRFWLDGILVAVVGSAGFVGNTLALVVLSRPQLRDVFHQLLLALACFDILFIVFGGISYMFRAFLVSTDTYTYIFPYLVHPMSHISMAGTIFMTLAISIERYMGLCHPLISPHSRKPWMYIVPVVVVSVALNVPKFFEITVMMEFDNATGLEVPTIANTALRHKKHYILGYVMWTRLFSTALIPVSLLVYLNIRIIIDLMNSTKVQRFGSARRQRKEINLSIVLLCIVVIFFCCHAARIILDIYEFSNVDKIMGCRPYAWWPSHEMQILVFFSHLLMILNSSVNFVVYCLVGHTFRREMCRAFGLRKYSRVPGVSRRSSRYDFSMAAPSTSAPPNVSFNNAGNTTRFMPTVGSNGNFRDVYHKTPFLPELIWSNNGTNSIKCVAIVSNNIAIDNNSTVSISSNAIVILPRESNSRIELAADKNIAVATTTIATPSTSTSATTTVATVATTYTSTAETASTDAVLPPTVAEDEATKDLISNKTNNGLEVKDNSEEDNNMDEIVKATSCLIENFSEKKSALFV